MAYTDAKGDSSHSDFQPYSTNSLFAGPPDFSVTQSTDLQASSNSDSVDPGWDPGICVFNKLSTYVQISSRTIALKQYCSLDCTWEFPVQF